MKDSIQNNSIRNFLTTKRLLDQDRKSLHRDTSSKSLSRTTNKLRLAEELQSDISPSRGTRRFEQLHEKTHYNTEEDDRYGDLVVSKPRRRDPPKEKEEVYYEPEINKKSALWSGITNVDSTFASSKQ